MTLDEILKQTANSKPLSSEERDRMLTECANKEQGKQNELDGYNCTLCNNKGHIITYRDGIPVAKNCECVRVRNILRSAISGGFSMDVLKNSTFEKFDAVDEWQKDIKTKAQNFCKDENAHCFYIGGQSGAGKTHLCTAIAGYFLKSGKIVKYMMWVVEAKKLKAIVNDSEEYRDRISVFKNAPVLYIDDFFKVKSGEQPTAADINLAFEILNIRLQDPGKITIISSEKTLDELCDYDEATAGRICQTAGVYKTNIQKDRKKNYRFKE